MILPRGAKIEVGGADKSIRISLVSSVLAEQQPHMNYKVIISNQRLYGVVGKIRNNNIFQKRYLVKAAICYVAGKSIQRKGCR